MKNRTSFYQLLIRFPKYISHFINFYFTEVKKQKHFIDQKFQFPKVQFYKNAFADDKCKFQGHSVLLQNVILTSCDVGEGTYFAPNSLMNRVNIGSYCSIGPEVFAGLGIHPSRNYVSTYPAFYSINNVCGLSFNKNLSFEECKETYIGNDVWVGARVTILDGVRIGNGAIIAAGAVVVKDVAPYTIVGGVPAKEIRKRFTKDQIDFLIQFQWWEKNVEWLIKHSSDFSNIEEFINNNTSRS